jgi:CRISPR system Cascade subunit CasE
VSLYMIELCPDMGALTRFIQAQGLGGRNADEDLGYGVHAWLAAAFGPLAPKPWRLFSDRRRPPRILGYTDHEVRDLRDRLREFAEPSVFAVCPHPDADVAGKPLPVWQSGRRLAFEVQCCPVGRQAATGVEKDLFLIRADAGSPGPLSRHDVYCAWAREHLQRDQAAVVTAIEVAGFRLVGQTRRPRNGDGSRKLQHLVRPQVVFRGELTVGETEAFGRLLAKGVGRHRSFGYGMLLLRPPS